MDRRIGIEIDRTTWPDPGQGPQIPTSFFADGATSTINVPLMLLVIGFLTTPPRSSGITLSEYWAWIRYLNAITSDDDLRITNDFYDLDAHQKTILSDDFGMGISMYWLATRLNLSLVCDGRYFIKTIASSVGAVARKTAKRGPNKSPDFVALDTNGIWHIIECKGTQTNDEYRDHQLFGDNVGTHTGARAQKNTIVFPSGYEGQRLACGILIANEKDQGQTSLKLIDPPAKEEEAFLVRTQDLDEARDAVSRSVLATSLRLAGFRLSSEVVASPLRRPRGFRRRPSREEQWREAKGRARNEIQTREVSVRETPRGQFSGREITMDLPIPLELDGKQINSVSIFQGVQKHVLDRVQEDDLSPDTDGAPATDKLELSRPTLSHDALQAELRISNTYLASIELRQRK